jgi:hypothetical protein
MSEEQSSRRNFLKFLGLSAGATLVSSSALAAFVDKKEILKLNPEQQEFMIRYGKWMDEFTEVIRIQKSQPDNLENQKKILPLSEKAERLQPELTEHMKDETFSIIYLASIERMSMEIK